MVMEDAQAHRTHSQGEGEQRAGQGTSKQMSDEPPFKTKNAPKLSLTAAARPHVRKPLSTGQLQKGGGPWIQVLSRGLWSLLTWLTSQPSSPGTTQQ